MKNHNRALLASLLGLAPLLASTPSQAGNATENLCNPSQFTEDKIQLNQAAKITPSGLMLTTNTDVAGIGTAFYKPSITLRTANTPDSERKLYNYFRMHMGPEGDYGLTSIIHADSSQEKAFGSNGEGLGFGGISKSIVFEFDNHADGGGGSSHVSLLFGSDFQKHLADAAPFPDFHNKAFDVKIEYDHTSFSRFRVYMKLATDASFPALPITWTVPSGGISPNTLDLSGQVGDEGWLGFTAAAGLIAGEANSHWISRWQFSNEGQPCGCPGDVCPANTLCDNDLGYCVPTVPGCMTDADCPNDPLTPRCDAAALDTTNIPYVQGVCVACINDVNCGHITDPTRPYCLEQSAPAVNECVECTEDSHCPSGICNPATHECDECRTDDDCPTVAEPRCNTSGLTAICDVCVENANCARFTDTPVCGAADTGNPQVCVECNVNADCNAELPICFTEENRCVECVTDDECTDPETPVCDATVHLCKKNRFVAGGGCDCSFAGEDGTTTAVAFAALFAAAAGLSRRRRRA